MTVFNRPPRVTGRTYYVREFTLSIPQRKQLDYICKKHEMTEKEIILALIKREALRLTLKEE